MAASGTSDALEAALDELYGVDPSEFVATRKRLAADLRTAGDKDAAKTLQAARRPTTAAWVLNQLSRHEPALVESFLEAGRELHAAQMGVRTDGREAMRDATRAHREALAAATDAALATLESRATDAYRTQILATLHAANLDDAVGEQLQQGRLIREITGSTGFPEGPGLTLVPDLEETPEPQGQREPPQRATRDRSTREDAAEKAKRGEQQRLERERAAAEQLERRRAEAEAAWQAAQDEVTAADSAAQTAHEQVEQLEQDLDRVRRAARAADDRAASARREAARLARAVMKLPS
jgi:chromosome segregation ATPase